MIITFSWPSTRLFGGGVVAIYEYANAMARRGHDVRFVHGPKTPDRIDHLDQLGWFAFDERVQHHITDSLDDPDLPVGDICFGATAPPRLGHQAVLIQGYKMIAAKYERAAFRTPCPKICVASWLIDVGVAWGSPREQMMYVPIGIDHDTFRSRVPLDERPVDVVMLYTDHPVKGGADGLAALEEVHRSRPDVKIELFGYLEPQDRLPEWVTFHTGSSREHLARTVYNRAKIFLQPSWREGFGLTPVEAMACGAALVTTDNGGSRDYALPGETALVTPVGQPAALAAAVLDLLDDDATRVRLASSGARFVRRFDWGLAGEALEAHLERYLADPGRYQQPPVDAPMFLSDTW